MLALTDWLLSKLFAVENYDRYVIGDLADMILAFVVLQHC